MSIRLLVGLGNPGAEYEATRHNAGVWWLATAARELGARLAPERGYQAQVGRVARPTGPVWLLQPLTYMNVSGRPVAALARFFRIEPGEILVVHDELDLPPGAARLKFGGGLAGHNGLRDCAAQLGTREFWRLRLGIGHPGIKAEVADFVLRRPPAAEREAIEAAVARTMAALEPLLDGAFDKAAALVHGKPPRPKPPLPAAPAASPADPRPVE